MPDHLQRDERGLCSCPLCCRDVFRKDDQSGGFPDAVIWRGLMVIEAAKAVAAGASMDEAIALAENLRDRTHLFAALSTLNILP